MFQFAAFALPVLCIQTGVTIRWGCPIRRSEDHSLVTGSSRLIAGSRVLHRLSMPRHPSCALSVLAMPTWPPLGTGACHAGLCGSDIRLASNCSRAPATQYSRSFSVQFNLRYRSLHCPEIQGRWRVRCDTTNTSLVKEARPLKRSGSSMVAKSGRASSP